MRIALAQINPSAGEIEKNIQSHLSMIRSAIAEKADAIFFPELSLTSYEPSLAQKCALQLSDPRLNVFQQLSDQHNILIGLGLPLKVNAGIQIAMAIFQSNKLVIAYAKQLLHDDEGPYFVEGNKQVLIHWKAEVLAPAICYESMQLDHSEKAIQMGASIYLALVAKNKAGIDKAALHYPAVAKQFSVPVVMVNCVGSCDDFLSVGQSAVWDSTGNKLSTLNSTEENLLVFDTERKSVF